MSIGDLPKPSLFEGLQYAPPTAEIDWKAVAHRLMGILDYAHCENPESSVAKSYQVIKQTMLFPSSVFLRPTVRDKIVARNDLKFGALESEPL